MDGARNQKIKKNKGVPIQRFNYIKKRLKKSKSWSPSSLYLFNFIYIRCVTLFHNLCNIVAIKGVCVLNYHNALFVCVMASKEIGLSFHSSSFVLICVIIFTFNSLQNDAIRNATGNSGGLAGTTGDKMIGGASGILNQVSAPNTAGEATYYRPSIAVTADLSKSLPIANEIRPYNFNMRMFIKI